MEQGYTSSYGEAILRGVYLTPYEFVWSRIWSDHTRSKRGLKRSFPTLRPPRPPARDPIHAGVYD
jgi:hypothetical protein